MLDIRFFVGLHELKIENFKVSVRVRVKGWVRVSRVLSIESIV